MGDPEQTDLIEYLAGEATRVAPRFPIFTGNAEAAMAYVQFEHTAFLRRSDREAGCVQIEHAEPACRFENGRADAELNAAAAPMSPHRLLVCLAVIGWPERELARRTGRLQTTVRRWTGGRSPVPSDVAAWVETLAAFHRAHPAPRTRQAMLDDPHRPSPNF